MCVSPEDNSNVYDLAMITLQEKNSGSADKVINPMKESFQLYAGNMKSIAVEPLTAKSTALTFIPSENVSGYNLSVSRIESMTTEALWLEDKKTGTWTDLRQTSEYAFEATPENIQERFTVHYVNRVPTGLENPISIYYRNTGSEVVITGGASDGTSNEASTPISGNTLILLLFVAMYILSKQVTSKRVTSYE